jgi:hypothetical protein
MRMYRRLIVSIAAAVAVLAATPAFGQSFKPDSKAFGPSVQQNHHTTPAAAAAAEHGPWLASTSAAPDHRRTDMTTSDLSQGEWRCCRYLLRG